MESPTGTASSPDCLDETTALDFVARRLDASAAAAASRHVDSCESCRRWIAALAHQEYGGMSVTLPSPAGSNATAEEGARRSGVSPENVLPPGSLVRGTPIGRFLVLDFLGKGGMGVVYSAYDSKLDRKVALKLLRQDAAPHQADERRARFLREAQVMARLSHPNVLPIYDAIAVSNARGEEEIFLAMELVDGQTLRKWLQARPRTWKEILGVFVPAGRGLAAAHQQGLVHRDFKPDNVLIDSNGRARVTDFGLARSVGEGPSLVGAPGNATSPAPLTQTGAVMGTPGYMAPEQSEGQTADARADQFSFCVSLYEALHGVMPHSDGTFREMAAEARAGRIQPAPTNARVPAWLRQVVLRGLRPNPQDRYPTMEALLDDLERVPQLTRGWWAAGAAVLVALSVAGYWQVQQRRQLCRGSEREWQGVWDAPRQATAKAAFLATGVPYAQDAWNGVERTMNAYARDWVQMHNAACEATRIRGEQSEEMLDLRMICLSQRLQEAKASVDLFQSADRKVIEKALQMASGLSPLSGCADLPALKASVKPPKDAATQARVEESRRQIAQAVALGRSGKYPEAEKLADTAVAQARAVGYPPVEAEALFQFGTIQLMARKDEPAEKTLEEAFFKAEAARDDALAAQDATMLVKDVGTYLARSADGHRWSRIARSLVERFEGETLNAARLDEADGSLLERDGKLDDAAAALRRSLSVREAALGPEHPDVASTLTRLGNVLDREGKRDEALEAYRRALAIRTKVFGPEHPDVAAVQGNMGISLEALGKYDEALAAYHSALAIELKAFGPDNPRVANTRYNLAVTLDDSGRYAEALEEHRHALAIREKALGPDHPDVAKCHDGIAGVLNDEGAHEEAVAEQRQALKIFQKTLGPDHLDVAQCHMNLALLLTTVKQCDEAANEQRQALETQEKTLGPEHPLVADSLSNLGDILACQGKYDEALATSRRALAIREKVFGPAHREVANSHDVIGRMLRHQRQYAEALAEHQRASEILVKVLGPEHPDTAELMGQVGEDLIELRRYADSITALQHALALTEGKSPKPEVIAEIHFALARALWDSRTDRTRATTFARSARDEYAKLPARKQELTEVTAWLPTHGGR
jgi:eukaryotic-like serine/threonine-protein kinase